MSNTVPTIVTAMAIVAVGDSSSTSRGGEGGGAAVCTLNDFGAEELLEVGAGDVCVGEINDGGTVDAPISVSGMIVTKSAAVVVTLDEVVVLGAQEITSDPVALALANTVPNRMMITSPSMTSITTFSLVAVAHPPKSLHVALATEAVVVVGQTARYTPSIVSVLKLHPSIVALPVHVARHSYQTSF